MTHRRHGGERGKEQSQHGEQQAKASGIMKRGVIFCRGGRRTALDFLRWSATAGLWRRRSVSAPGVSPDRAATRPPSAPRAACSRPPTSSAGFGNERKKLKAFSKAVLLRAEVGALLSLGSFRGCCATARMKVL